MTVLLVSLAIFLILGIPVAYSVGLSSAAYFIFYQPALLEVLPQRLFAGFNSDSLIALPLFIMMGGMMNAAGITEKLIEFSMIFVRRIRGGLGLVNVIASMIFGGISGSSASDTASIGAVLIPAMIKRGYTMRFSSGITVASSTMGMIIPPSVVMVLYAVTAQQSVGRLFLGGLIPGVMIGLLQLLIVYFIAIKDKCPREEGVLKLSAVARQVFTSFPVLLMPLVIVGSVVSGIVTPTESAAIGIAYALLIAPIYRRHFLKDIPKVLSATAITTAKIMLIIAMSQLYIWVLALERIPEQIAALITQLNLSPLAFLLLFEVILLILGTFTDVSPAILLMTPVFLPVALELGISPIHFGVILVTSLAVGSCTPPVGTCLNVCSAIAKVGIGEVFKGALPFLLANIMTIILIAIFPSLVTALPSLLI